MARGDLLVPVATTPKLRTQVRNRMGQSEYRYSKVLFYSYCQYIYISLEFSFYFFIQTFRTRACQSLSHTIKQDNPDKPIRVEWEKRGERQIIMSPDHIWKKWEDVFQKYEAGELIDLDTKEEIKKSPNAADLMSLCHVTGTLLRGLASASMENLGEAADHIMSNPPRIYLGKAPKKWTWALPLDKWCERRKWKDVIVKAIGDRIMYFERKTSNMFLDENQHIDQTKWRKWKQEKCFSSTIMQAIFFTDGADSFISETIAANRKSPDFPPKEVLVKIDMALVNQTRSEAVAEGNWSVFVPWKEDGRISLSTVSFGVSGNLVTEMEWRVNPRKLGAGILDLRNFPLVSAEMEMTVSWNKILQMMEIRGLKMGLKTNDAWMIITQKDRRNVDDIIRSHFFPGHRCKRLAYTFSLGEPGYKHKSSEVEISYLEVAYVASNGTIKHRSDLYGEEKVKGAQFDKQEYYRAEHKDTLSLDELRMEVYIRFIATHTHVNDNVILGFAGSKALRACRVSYIYGIVCLLCFRTCSALMFSDLK